MPTILYAMRSLTFMPTLINLLCTAGVQLVQYMTKMGDGQSERAGYVLCRALVYQGVAMGWVTLGVPILPVN